MNADENFKKLCSEQEVIDLMSEATVELFENVISCYQNGYKESISNDIFFKHGQALTAVYILGYVSGVRKERQKKAVCCKQTAKD